MINLFGKEAGFPVGTALHDVLRDPGGVYAWAAWHDGYLIEKYSKLTPLVTHGRAVGWVEAADDAAIKRQPQRILKVRYLRTHVTKLH